MARGRIGDGISWRVRQAERRAAEDLFAFQLRAATLKLATARLLHLLRKANFDPSQPRVPRGESGGGRWTDGGSTLVAQNMPTDDAGESRRYLIDLRDHEGRDGGHAIAMHVNKTDTFLIGRMQFEKADGLTVSSGLRRSGSFHSLEAANKLVSATLAKNAEIVDRVVKGDDESAFVKFDFHYKTGREFYRDVPRFSIFRPKDSIMYRDVNNVGVLIVHDPSMPEGFRIITAYPRTDD